MPDAAVGFVVQPTYRVRDGVPVVQLFGRLDDGSAFLVEDDRFRPYFFATPGTGDALAGHEGVTVCESPLESLDGRPLLRVEAPVPGAVPALRDAVRRAGGAVYEADVRFPYRYLIDHDLRGGVAIEGRSRRREGLLVFANPALRPAAVRPRLHVVSLDLETTPDASAIFAAALFGGDVDEVHLVAPRPVAGAVVYEEERALLAALLARIAAIDPDVITGWNVVDFDLRTLVQRCAALRLPARLGRVPGDVLFQQDLGFTRQSRATLPGRMVLDGIPLVRDAVRLEDYRLETVARALLGRGKKIDQDVDDAAEEIQRLHREDPEALVAYNREDAKLVLEVLEAEGLLELTLERSLLTGMQLDRVGASIASFDLLYLPELRRRGVVAPSVDPERRSSGLRGGAVLDSVPGLFRDVAVFDFKSLYPSLIRTFQLDPLAHARAKGDALEAPNGAHFAREGAILPEILERFSRSREQAKRRGDVHADQAIKIMMNALYGVLGAASCRFFSPEIANAITGFGQQTLQWTRDAFQDRGVEVIYGDTDSVFVQLPRDATSPGEVAEGLRAAVAAGIEARVRERYRVEPRLELELEKVYERFFMPRVRGGRSGSKKRYAGWHDGRLEVVGLESVRRDWPAVARRLQRGLLERVFRDEDPMPFVQEVVAAVRSGELDAELVYVKRVRKGSLDRYTSTTPPHVQAARKLRGRVGPVVRYVVTAGGPEPVILGRPLPEAIDRGHYLERVLRPVADAILDALGHSFDEALGRPHQLDLL